MSTSSPDKIIVRFFDDDDGSGKLWVSGSANGFAGTAEAWINTTELQEFAQALTRYPLSKNDLPTLSGGICFSDGKEQEYVFLQAFPVDSLGRLGIEVRLATEVWPEHKIQTQHRVQFELRTGYQALLEFSRMLNAVIMGEAEEAVLIGDA